VRIVERVGLRMIRTWEGHACDVADGPCRRCGDIQLIGGGWDHVCQFIQVQVRAPEPIASVASNECAKCGAPLPCSYHA
jgi:hypothetical protein